MNINNQNFYCAGVSIILIVFSTFFLQGGEPIMPPESNRMKPDHLPTPYSAAEIRAACPNGRQTKYRFKITGRPDSIQVTHFVNCTGEKANFETITTDMEGKQVGDTQSAQATWQELQSHASFPAAYTTISSTSYTTPAGTYDCWLYQATTEAGGKKDVKRLWFARTLPGPPICFEQFVDDQLMFRMTMIENQVK